MTQETFELARHLKTRILHITECIELLSRYEYRLDPPIRQSNIRLMLNDSMLTLNEGEVVFLKKALSEEKDRLIQEFNNL